MKTVASSDVTLNFFDILEWVKQGEEVVIQHENTHENIAVFISYQEFQHRGQRPLGILKGKAQYRIKENFAMTDEELVNG